MLKPVCVLHVVAATVGKLTRKPKLNQGAALVQQNSKRLPANSTNGARCRRVVDMHAAVHHARLLRGASGGLRCIPSCRKPRVSLLPAAAMVSHEASFCGVMRCVRRRQIDRLCLHIQPRLARQAAGRATLRAGTQPVPTLPSQEKHKPSSFQAHLSPSQPASSSPKRGSLMVRPPTPAS